MIDCGVNINFCFINFCFLNKDDYLLKAKASQGGKTWKIKGLIRWIIKVINRLKTKEEVSPEQVHRRLVNLYILLQDTAQVNVT